MPRGALGRWRAGDFLRGTGALPTLIDKMIGKARGSLPVPIAVARDTISTGADFQSRSTWERGGRDTLLGSGSTSDPPGHSAMAAGGGPVPLRFVHSTQPRGGHATAAKRQARNDAEGEAAQTRRTDSDCRALFTERSLQRGQRSSLSRAIDPFLGFEVELSFRLDVPSICAADSARRAHLSGEKRVGE